MAKAKIDLVQVYDPSVDSIRKFPLRVMTRAAKRELRVCVAAMAEYADEIPDNALEVTDEQEDRATRLMCNVIDVGTEEPKDGPGAGTLLYEGWVADLEQVTDEEIAAAYNLVTRTESTPPT